LFVIRASILTHTSKEVLKAMGPKSDKGPIWPGIQNKMENDQSEIQDTWPNRVFSERHSDSPALIESLRHSISARKK
jgi:hypothetical protein